MRTELLQLAPATGRGVQRAGRALERCLSGQLTARLAALAPPASQARRRTAGGAPRRRARFPARPGHPARQ